MERLYNCGKYSTLSDDETGAHCPCSSYKVPQCKVVRLSLSSFQKCQHQAHWWNIIKYLYSGHYHYTCQGHQRPHSDWSFFPPLWSCQTYFQPCLQFLDWCRQLCRKCHSDTRSCLVDFLGHWHTAKHLTQEVRLKLKRSYKKKILLKAN